MNDAIRQMVLPLFVPADRPERFAKAAVSGADVIVIDLEDAVAPDMKERARAGLADGIAGLAIPVVVRVNAVGTPWHYDDIALLGTLPLAGILLAKAETTEGCAEVAERTGKPVAALIETAAGLHRAPAIAAASARLAFGSFDFVVDLGMSHTREALLSARSALVMAARLAGQPAPIDGVTTAVRDEALVEDDCRHAASLGLGGKLLIHPAQVAPARRGFAPLPAAVDWATRVLATEGSAVSVVDGQMVDGPVLARARLILARARGAADASVER